MSLSWFPFYHGDYLRDTSRLSPSQHGVYLLLLVSFFNDGPLPNDPDTLCRIAAGASPSDVHEILKRYWVLTDGGWVNLKMDEVRQQCIERDEKNRAKAIAAAHARWGESSKQCLEHSPEQCTSTSTSTTISTTKREGRFTPPTAAEVTEYAKSIGYLIRVELFMSHYEANGWKVGRVPMKDWKAAVRQWKARDSEPRAKAKKEPML
jgi:uncharacterized protein YdaU (DUF1376 family)